MAFLILRIPKKLQGSDKPLFILKIQIGERRIAEYQKGGMPFGFSFWQTGPKQMLSEILHISYLRLSGCIGCIM